MKYRVGALKRNDDSMNGKINNPFWCCDKIEELIQEYKCRQNTLDKYGYSLDTKVAIRNELETVIGDLERILYE